MTEVKESIPFHDMQPTIDYLHEFFRSHIRDYLDMQREAESGRHPSQYREHPEIIQGLRSLLSNIQEPYWNLSIPSAFPSPERLLEALIGLQKSAEKLRDLAQGLGEKIGWKGALSEAAQIADGVASAIKHALTLMDGPDLPMTGYQRILNTLMTLPRVAKELKTRRKDGAVPRRTLEITDEYDIQDLLRSVLYLDFNDIRQEEWTPSFAGSSKRMDFVVQDEKIVIEVKRPNGSATQTSITNELAIDIACYKTHPNCRRIVFYIWDDLKRLANPHALKSDFEAANPGFVTIVVVH